MSRRKGLFITLEGNEGCGKSTQIGRLAGFLESQGQRVFLTREPGGTVIGDEIRSILLNPSNHKMNAYTETLLYMASRAQLVREVIESKLKEGVTVLSDRWLDATLAYQGYAGGVSPAWIRKMASEVLGGLTPDLSLYLDLPVEEGMKRVARSRVKDRMEQKSLLYHQKVRKGFLEIARLEPKRFKRVAIKPTDTIDDVSNMIQEKVKVILK